MPPIRGWALPRSTPHDPERHTHVVQPQARPSFTEQLIFFPSVLFTTVTRESIFAWRKGNAFCIYRCQQM